MKIPVGCTVVGGSNQRIKVQNDEQDWILDETLKPVEPVNKKRLIQEGGNIDPKNIPFEFIRTEKITKVDYDKTYVVGSLGGSWFKELPDIIDTEIVAQKLQIKKTIWEEWNKNNSFGKYDSKPVVVQEFDISIIVSGEITYYMLSGKGKLTK